MISTAQVPTQTVSGLAIATRIPPLSNPQALDLERITSLDVDRGNEIDHDLFVSEKTRPSFSPFHKIGRSRK